MWTTAVLVPVESARLDHNRQKELTPIALPAEAKDMDVEPPSPWKYKSIT